MPLQHNRYVWMNIISTIAVEDYNQILGFKCTRCNLFAIDQLAKQSWEHCAVKAGPDPGFAKRGGRVSKLGGNWLI